ncbi:MAG: nucleotidyltransferase family protein [Planctomycetes bacterium]|nr:nucleotidyltransferase family protein [Planctomycetota bacterium]
MNYALARNIIIYDELSRILPAFHSAGIKTILLAGAALGATVYDNIGQRQMGDIDLLIRHRDTQRIGELLGDLGYVLDTARSDEAHYSKTIGEFTLHIDCHTDLRHYLDDKALAGVWARAVKSPLLRGDLGVCNSFVLSPEDTLIYTAVDSAVYHGRITPTVLKDIELIIKHYSISSELPLSKGGQGVVRVGVSGLDWHLVIQLLKSYRLETPLHILFDRCRKEGVPIPDEVMHSLHPRKRSLEYYLYTILLGMSKSPHPPFAKGERGGLEDKGVLSDDLSRILRFLTRPAARWEVFLNSFFPSLRFVKQSYDLNDEIPSNKRGRGVLLTILYPLRFLSLIWRMNKAMYQFTLRML